jgi:hypothetical protein
VKNPVDHGASGFVFFPKKVLDDPSLADQTGFIHHVVEVVLITSIFSETMVSGLGLCARQS